MLRKHRTIRLVRAAARTIGLLAAASTGFAQQQFKRLPETMSPDGAYVLAWAPDEAGNDASPPKLDEMVEVAFDDESFDEKHKDGEATNYLVETATGKVVAMLPGFGYWRGPNWHKNRADLEVAWRSDGAAALVIYSGRGGSEAIAWLVPARRQVVDVQKQLETAFRRVLRKHQPRFRDVDVRFTGPIITANGSLLVRASGSIPKEDNTADYLLSFKIGGEAEKVRLQLQSGRKLSDSDNQGEVSDDGHLNAVYRRVTAGLPAKERDALRAEQEQWLKTREMIGDEGSRRWFTDARVEALRTLEASLR